MENQEEYLRADKPEKPEKPAKDKLPKRKDRTEPDKSWRPGEDDMDYTSFRTFTRGFQKLNKGKVYKNIADASEDARIVLKLVSYHTDEIVALAKRVYPRPDSPDPDDLRESGERLTDPQALPPLED